MEFRVLHLLVAVAAMCGNTYAEPDGSTPQVEVEVPSCDYEPPRIQKTTVSKSGRMMLEFGPAEGNPMWVSVRSTDKGAESQHVFTHKDGLYVEAEISDDDRLIVASSGGASSGEYLDVFVRKKSGKYQKHEVDLTSRTWALIKKAQKLPSSASLGHYYANSMVLYSDPLSVVFRVGGDYSGDEIAQTRFGPFYFRYTIGSKKLEIVPQPAAAESEEK